MGTKNTKPFCCNSRSLTPVDRVITVLHNRILSFVSSRLSGHIECNNNYHRSNTVNISSNGYLLSIHIEIMKSVSAIVSNLRSELKLELQSITTIEDTVVFFDLCNVTLTGNWTGINISAPVYLYRYKDSLLIVPKEDWILAKIITNRLTKFFLNISARTKTAHEIKLSAYATKEKVSGWISIAYDNSIKIGDQSLVKIFDSYSLYAETTNYKINGSKMSSIKYDAKECTIGSGFRYEVVWKTIVL